LVQCIKGRPGLSFPWSALRLSSQPMGIRVTTRHFLPPVRHSQTLYLSWSPPAARQTFQVIQSFIPLPLKVFRKSIAYHPGTCSRELIIDFCHSLTLTRQSHPRYHCRLGRLYQGRLPGLPGVSGVPAPPKPSGFGVQRSLVPFERLLSPDHPQKGPRVSVR